MTSIDLSDLYKGREIGRGSFGTPSLERSERGRSARGPVKEIAKYKINKIRIGYKEGGRWEGFKGEGKVTRQLLKAPILVHQEGFAHRSLKSAFR